MLLLARRVNRGCSLARARGIRATCHYGFNADISPDTRKHRRTKIEACRQNAFYLVLVFAWEQKGERERERETLAPFIAALNPARAEIYSSLRVAVCIIFAYRHRV